MARLEFEQLYIKSENEVLHLRPDKDGPIHLRPIREGHPLSEKVCVRQYWRENSQPDMINVRQVDNRISLPGDVRARRVYDRGFEEGDLLLSLSDERRATKSTPEKFVPQTQNDRESEFRKQINNIDNVEKEHPYLDGYLKLTVPIAPPFLNYEAKIGIKKDMKD